MSVSTISTIPSVSPPATSGARIALRLRFLPASSRAEALLLWRRLELQLSNPRLACSSIWTETWLNHYGEFVAHQFVVGMRGADVCGIALLTQGVDKHVGPFHLKTWHVGTAGEPESESVCIEFNTLLAGPHDFGDFAEALWKWAREETACDEFRMDGFETTTLPPLEVAGLEVVVQSKSSYYYDLGPSRDCGEEPLMRLGSQTRSNIRRTMRELGPTRVEWAETSDHAESLFRDLVQLHQARWNASGMPGAYASRRFHDFHLDLVRKAVPLKVMAMVGIKAGDRLIGCNQVPIDGRRAQIYQSGRVPAAGRVSYGMVLDYHCICECLRRGYDTVEFLAGDGEHKRRLSTHRGELSWVTWRRNNWKNSAIDALRIVKRAASRLGRSDSTAPASPAEAVQTEHNLESAESP